MVCGVCVEVGCFEFLIRLVLNLCFQREFYTGASLKRNGGVAAMQLRLLSMRLFDLFGYIIFWILFCDINKYILNF